MIEPFEVSDYFNKNASIITSAFTIQPVICPFTALLAESLKCIFMRYTTLIKLKSIKSLLAHMSIMQKHVFWCCLN